MVSLFESGITFDDLAVQYSEIASGQFGGDAGYVCIDDLDEEMKGVWMREVDQISEVIELEDRFVVAAAYDLVESEDTEACTQIGWQKIVLYKNTLSDLLADYKDSAVIKIYGQ